MLDPSDTLPHTLVPVALAVEVIWGRVYDDGKPAPETKERLLNSIASTLSVTGRLYEYVDDAKPRALSPADIKGGVFKGGGKELHFSDGRPARRHLAVPTDDVPAAIQMERRKLLGAAQAMAEASLWSVAAPRG
jgi:hypothetical protein